MKQHRETEVKLSARDPKQLRKSLSQLGFRVLRPRHFESNYLFDFRTFGCAKHGVCCDCVLPPAKCG